MVSSETINSIINPPDNYTQKVIFDLEIQLKQFKCLEKVAENISFQGKINLIPNSYTSIKHYSFPE
jgi:hypothetical protein